jgi:hypothetical protein
MWWAFLRCRTYSGSTNDGGSQASAASTRQTSQRTLAKKKTARVSAAA